VLVTAHGFLSEPSIPDIAGMDSFRGQIMHSAQWDPSYDVTGKRVAVIGTGASAVQLVPRVHEFAKSLAVFQRTPAWILPHRGRDIREWEKTLYRRVPLAQRVIRELVYYRGELLFLPALLKSQRLELIKKMSLEHLENQVPDPELRAKLTPTFAPGCKRLTPTNEYLPAVASPKTELVTDGIDAITPEGIRTKDGVVREFDVIILATGFRVTNNTFPSAIKGRDGRTLREVWSSGSMGAYNGTTFSGFPNLFMLAGPNTGIGHTSLVYMIEAQLPYVLQALELMDERHITSLDVRADVQDAYNEELQRKLVPSVWNSGGCSSWYLDEKGRNSTIWPDYTFRFKKRLQRFDLESYYQQVAPVSAERQLAAV
jgi:cation diffusion facilitator CzcD-associated flavoprotein CzcO